MFKKKFLKISLVWSLALIFIALLSFSGNCAETYTWNIQSNLSPGDTGYETLAANFIENVEKMSNGKLKLNLHPVNSLFPIKQGIEAVGSGAVQMAMLTGGYFQGKLGPISTIEAGLPGAERNFIERYNFFYEEGFLEFVRNIYKKHNIFYLAPHIGPSWDIMSKKPIRSLDDFKGLKIRAYGIEAEWFKKLGASTVFLPGSELYTALATGTVDAVRWANPTSNFQIGLHEIAKFYLQNSPMPAPNNFYAVNLQAWNSLSNDLQSILEFASQNISYISAASYKDKLSLQKMKENGVEITKIPDEEWKKGEAMVRDIWQNYKNHDEQCKQAVNMLNDYLEYLGR